MVSSDSLFHALPKVLQTIIDEAFIATGPPRPSTSGGSNGDGGGFLLEDNEPEGPDHIPLDLIPAALQRLDLPPDDPEVLAVFRNAASGWTSSSLDSHGLSHAQETYVGRDDWRSVCAVLLESRAADFANGKSLSTSSHSPRVLGDDGDDEDASMTDDYVEDSQSDLEQEDSDEEYQDDAGMRSSRRRRNRTATTGSRRSLSPPARLSEKKPGQPTSRQRQTCLNTFSLFFPEIPSQGLGKLKITVADIQRVATLLGEKLKAEEMLEMLEMFSTSPDKSMDFDDFTRMMIVAKLA
ncbi:hypothetical protein M413DRAFT_379728 [Hebeloma cylindrosporum]|uniref:EF-hand domain-containing protein n=1 Tax=Hebeloma cylindrosporum TaxID=76867 RepID=A0A0C3C655_HEBCY|nr:hypothetical protein M413DRAFT_379728 [Hebeloma cylindrosporum h7]